jgi:hypothetical protein
MFLQRVSIGMRGLLVASVTLLLGCSEGQKPSPLKRTGTGAAKPADTPEKGRLGEAEKKQDANR